MIGVVSKRGLLTYFLSTSWTQQIPLPTNKGLNTVPLLFPFKGKYSWKKRSYRIFHYCTRRFPHHCLIYARLEKVRGRQLRNMPETWGSRQSTTFRMGSSVCPNPWLAFRGVSSTARCRVSIFTIWCEMSQPQSTYRGRVDIGGMCLLSQLERTPQLCTWWQT